MLRNNLVVESQLVSRVNSLLCRLTFSVETKHDVPVVFDKRFRVDARRYWTTRVDFRLDFVRHGAQSTRKVRIGSVFGNRCIGEYFHGVAVATMIARAARIHGRTRRVHLTTKSVRRVARAGLLRNEKESVRISL